MIQPTGGLFEYRAKLSDLMRLDFFDAFDPFDRTAGLTPPLANISKIPIPLGCGRFATGLPERTLD
jgi:hypothetical protein